MRLFCKTMSVLGVLVTTLSVQACYIETVHEPDNDNKSNTTDYSLSKNEYGSSCSDVKKDSLSESSQCEEDHRNLWVWNGQCKFQDCRFVEVFVHYMLSQDLGTSMNAVVEAFDNDKFNGSPVSKTIIHGFDAKRAGNYEKGKLVLMPGRYYLRAYLSDASAPVPYEYEGLKLIGEKPVGTYGGLSSLGIVDVPYSKTSIPSATIYIDKLFQKNAVDARGRAFLRALIKAEGNLPNCENCLVRVGIYDSADFARVPVKEVTVTIQSLKAPSSAGYAEAIEDSIPVGRYYVFAYLDTNDNSYFDDDELFCEYRGKDHSQATAIKIENSRTETIRLTLKPSNT